MKLSEIINSIKTIEITNFTERDISHAISDSREKFKDSIFIAVKGLTSDGADFANDAVNSGSTAVIYETEIKKVIPGITYIKVEDARIIQSKVAGMVYSEPAKKLKLTGVTGTNGKTSTAYIYRHILESNNIRCCLLGTTEYDLGNRKFVPSRTTPDAVFLQRYLHEIVSSGIKNTVMEVSSHALSLHRVKDIYFNSAVFTNLTQDHLDFHKTMDEYAAAKAVLFSGQLKDGALSVINKDDPYSQVMIKSASDRVKTFSEKDPASDIFINNIRYMPDGMEIEYIYEGKPLLIKTNLNGRFQAYNIAAAILAVSGSDLDKDQIITAFRRPLYIPGRMEKIFDNEFQIIIDYAHTPDALERAVKTISEFKTGRLITIFGCGGNRDIEKRPLMGNIAVSNSDLAIITSDNPRDEDPGDIISGIVKGITGGDFEIVKDRRSAIKRGMESARKGDIILIAGKGHENYQEIKGVKYPYSDAETVMNLSGRSNG